MGGHAFTFRGAENRLSGQRPLLTVNSIIVVKGKPRQLGFVQQAPPLSNRQLCLRDAHLCLYCGREFSELQLPRDHRIPFSNGARERCSNVVTARRPSITHNRTRTPDEAHMLLLAVAYEPNRAEYLVLSNRSILADQMNFQKVKRFGRHRRL